MHCPRAQSSTWEDGDSLKNVLKCEHERRERSSWNAVGRIVSRCRMHSGCSFPKVATQCLTHWVMSVLARSLSALPPQQDETTTSLVRGD